MEDDLKISIVEFLSNHLLDQTQMLNLSLDDQPYFTNHLNKDDLQWKTPSKYKRGISQQPLNGSNLNVKLKLRLPNNILQILKTKTTSVKSGISLQSNSNFELKIKCQNHILQILEMKTTSNGILIVEYLSNHLLDQTQILNLCLDD
jgi:hypothetical protein